MSLWHNFITSSINGGLFRNADLGKFDDNEDCEFEYSNVSLKGAMKTLNVKHAVLEWKPALSKYCTQ